MTPCSLGVGCEQYGVCYAYAHNRPDMCGLPEEKDVIVKFKDHELLEKAAKAVGRGETRRYDVQGGIWTATKAWPSSGEYWNPLDHNDDALALAIAIGLTIHCPHANSVYAGVGEYPHQFLENVKTQSPEAAVRRAIVRAAAALGEKIAN